MRPLIQALSFLPRLISLCSPAHCVLHVPEPSPPATRQRQLLLAFASFWCSCPFRSPATSRRIRFLPTHVSPVTLCSSGPRSCSTLPVSRHFPKPLAWILFIFFSPHIFANERLVLPVSQYSDKLALGPQWKIGQLVLLFHCTLSFSFSAVSPILILNSSVCVSHPF